MGGARPSTCSGYQGDDFNRRHSPAGVANGEQLVKRGRSHDYRKLLEKEFTAVNALTVAGSGSIWIAGLLDNEGHENG